MNHHNTSSASSTSPTPPPTKSTTSPLDEARRILLEAPAEAVGHIHGSFALIARAGKTVKMARSLDRPMRYFLAKRQEGPALIVAPRIDAIYRLAQS